MQIKFHNVSLGMRFLNLFNEEWGTRNRKLYGIAVWVSGTKITNYKMTSVQERALGTGLQLCYSSWYDCHKPHAMKLKRPLKITVKICDKTTSA